MVSPRSTLLVAALVLTAGCLGGTPQGDEEPAAPAGGEEAEPGEDAPQAASPSPAPAPVNRSVDWEGTLATTVCAPNGPDGCSGYTTGGERFHELDLDGGFEAASLTLTWDARTPLVEELSISVTNVSSCGDGCRLLLHVATAEGPSPLTLDVDDLGLPANATVALTVDVPRQTPSPVYAIVSHPQPFHVRGTVTVQPGAGGA